MKLCLTGHDYKYAVEQIMLALFPDERPEYCDKISDAGENSASVAVHIGAKYATATAVLFIGGVRSYAASRVSVSELSGKLAADRLLQKAVKTAFYRAAMRLRSEAPAWGALTGVRPGTIFTKMLERGATEQQAIREMENTYFVSHGRALLCADTAKASLKTAKMLAPRDIALYVGIPFCPTRCAYCSFVSQSVKRSMALIPDFLAALYKEIEASARLVRSLGLRIISVYIGGGTPTTLCADELDGLIGKLRREFDLSACREFCVEAGRPDTVTEDKLRALTLGGVTRVSINPQTMDDAVLAAIGRRHSADDVRSAYALTRKHFSGSVNMDLIAGLPCDSAAGFEKTLTEVISMAPENVTVHTLSLKKGTKITLEGTPIPDKAAVGAMLDFAVPSLRDAGYAPYYLYRQKFMSGGFENVGWSIAGEENLYNILIMEELCTVLALGGGASTKFVDPSVGRIERIFNAKYPREYIDSIEKIISDKDKLRGFYLEKR